MNFVVVFVDASETQRDNTGPGKVRNAETTAILLVSWERVINDSEAE